MTNRYEGNFLSVYRNVCNFCANLAAIFTAAGRQRRLKQSCSTTSRKILTTNWSQNILLFYGIANYMSTSLSSHYCILMHLFEDHTNYVFFQVILCSMCTAQGNGREDG